MHPTGRLRAGPARLPYLLLLLFVTCAHVIAAEDFLPPEQAFRVAVQPDGADAVQVRWVIADGYYLYKNRLRFSTQTPGMTLGDPALPPAQRKQDSYFGEVQIYRQALEARLPLTRLPGSGETLALEISSQGCADGGLCYPPQPQRLLVTLPPVPAAASASARPSAAMPAGSSPVGAAPQGLGQAIAPPRPGLADDSLTADQAFGLAAEVTGPDRLQLTWVIAPETYLYRDKVVLALEDAPGVALGPVQLPPGEVEQNGVRPDGSSGEVAVYRERLDLTLPIERMATVPTAITVVAKYQGCADRGICYPPQARRIRLALPASASAARAPDQAPAVVVPGPVATVPTSSAEPVGRPGLPAEQDRIAAVLVGGHLPAVVALFFGFGLLLAFTPCVFPMIPILSGIIAGHGAHLTTRRAFVLSLVYVLAMALTYTAAGVLAGLFGANLQVTFQNPWILTAFALIFVLLALAMFGFYHLQLPSGLHARLAALSHQQQGGTLIGVAIMGVLSALIVGPCVAPPLAGALIYISQTGDAVLGGVALFALSLGMGAPLIAIGTSAGKLLPRAGAWMGVVNAVFGVALLGVAITLLERIVPAAVAMILWGLLLIGCAVYLGALRQLPPGASGWGKLWQGLGVGLLIYGALMLVGAAAGSRDTLQPLRGLMGAGLGVGAGAPASVTFKRIKTLADLDRELAAARAAGRPTLLDFYADWCVACKELEFNTFSDPAVIAAMSRFVLLQADVTANDAADQALMQGHFKLPGPPAMLFFDAAGGEVSGLRLVGFTPPESFVQHLRRVGP